MKLLLLALAALVAGSTLLMAASTADWSGRLEVQDRPVELTGWTGRLGTGDFRFWNKDCLMPVAYQHEMIGSNGSGGIHFPNSKNFSVTAAGAGGLTCMWSTTVDGHLIIWKDSLVQGVPAADVVLDPKTKTDGTRYYEGTGGTGSNRSTIRFQFWLDDPSDPTFGGNWAGVEYNPDNPDECRANCSKYNTWK